MVYVVYFYSTRFLSIFSCYMFMNMNMCCFMLHRFIEGDFDAYVERIEKPYVWGGEPELLMASHVLK